MQENLILKTVFCLALASQEVGDGYQGHFLFMIILGKPRRMTIKRTGLDPVDAFLGANDLYRRKVLKKKASSD